MFEPEPGAPASQKLGKAFAFEQEPEAELDPDSESESNCSWSFSMAETFRNLDAFPSRGVVGPPEPELSCGWLRLLRCHDGGLYVQLFSQGLGLGIILQRWWQSKQ